MTRIPLFSTIAASIILATSAVPLDNTATRSLVGRSPKSPTHSGIFPSSSPAYLPDFPFHGVAPLNPVPTGPIDDNSDLDESSYPSPWEQPDVEDEEVQRAISAIDWDHVPDFPVREEDGPGDYDYDEDPACWWTYTQCGTPKASYLPDDVKFCPNKGDFGLTYDDGPLVPDPVHNGPDDPWAEPHLYDFLASRHQTATLFYVGSNVVSYPQAALRALQSGHTLCAHTWSHPKMTSLSNHEVVAQLYWSIRAIKEAAGVTTRCWRPPYGDVDDRVRAIAHQMGLSTIIWNSDSFDWGLASTANGFVATYDSETVDGFFQQWIDDVDKDDEGRIVLEHETSSVTIKTSEKWLPKLQEAFHVQKVHDCAPQLPSPYWES